MVDMRVTTIIIGGQEYTWRDNVMTMYHIAAMREAATEDDAQMMGGKRTLDSVQTIAAGIKWQKDLTGQWYDTGITPNGVMLAMTREEYAAAMSKITEAYKAANPTQAGSKPPATAKTPRRTKAPKPTMVEPPATTAGE